MARLSDPNFRCACDQCEGRLPDDSDVWEVASFPICPCCDSRVFANEASTSGKNWTAHTACVEGDTP